MYTYWIPEECWSGREVSSQEKSLNFMAYP